MADQGGIGNSLLRDFRKGNWTIQETMILIEAKKMDDERRMKRSGESSSEGGRINKPTELRWKWVEDYCWRKGCFRSQNQCNDKWDNLMRDYKKVRDYERRLLGDQKKDDDDDQDGSTSDQGSYWKIEKNERKDKNLPSNMLPQIYYGLAEVVEKKGTQRLLLAGGGGGASASVSGGSGGSNPNNMGYVAAERPITLVQPPALRPLMQHQISAPMAALPLPPPSIAAAPPPPPPAQQPPPPPLPFSHPLPTTMCDSSDSDTSEYSDSPAKRRRRGSRGGGGGGEGTTSGSTSNQVGSAISKSASIIAEAIQACEEREERRHRELLSLHERRLKIEESKTEINKQGINGLVDAINKLANSILALASHNKNQSPPPK